MSTLEKQKKEHIYLTSGCCEPTDHVGRRRLHELGLGYGWWNGSEVITANHDDALDFEFYPLTADEAKLIAEDGFSTGEGYVGRTGYSTLYKGKKWLTPTVEIEWHTEDKQRYGYSPEDMHAPTADGALSIARRLAACATARLASINGYAEIEEPTNEEPDDGHARWTVALHVPMEWAVKNLKTFEAYQAFLMGVTL